MVVNREKRKRVKLGDALIFLLMLGVMFLTAYPLYFSLIASVSDPRGLLRQIDPLVAPIPPLTLQGYILCLNNPNIINGLKNTLFYLVFGTVISLALTIAAAFVLSRRHFLLRGVVMKLMMVTMYFNGGLIPFFLLIRNIGLYNTRWVMILPYAISTYNVIVMRSFFLSLPQSLEESAVLDGANDLHVLIRVVIPLSAPVIAVITMYYAVGYWNAWYPSLIFHRSREYYPLQMILRELLILNEPTEQTNMGEMLDEPFTRELVKYCAIVITTVPILVIYPFLQRYFVKGVMIGAIKG